MLGEDKNKLHENKVNVKNQKDVWIDIIKYYH